MKKIKYSKVINTPQQEHKNSLHNASGGIKLEDGRRRPSVDVDAFATLTA